MPACKCLDCTAVNQRDLFLLSVNGEIRTTVKKRTKKHHNTNPLVRETESGVSTVQKPLALKLPTAVVLTGYYFQRLDTFIHVSLTKRTFLLMHNSDIRPYLLYGSHSRWVIIAVSGFESQ